MKTDEDYEIDDLDRKILRELYKDARVSFVEIAQKLTVSGGTIHQRVNKLKLNGILRGFQPVIDEARLGFGVTSMIGIYLKNAKDCSAVLDKLEKLPEVTEAYYTTGSYALILKIVTKDIQKFQLFLMDKLQGIAEIQSTESFICLSQPIKKNVKIF
jgi:Lrp/AsnC family transcriptional regulator for asnA, asnC and gidA